MIPNETLQEVSSIGPLVPVTEFRLTQSTQARILSTLSDNIYTRKSLAVIREYSTNAADAHVVAGKPIDRIEVTLPTMDNLNFRIRDYGHGLSDTEFKDIFCVFGESSKRTDNRLNGVLGYGCKAGFAHADTFTITSWNNGVKTIYQCIKGDSTKLPGVIQLESCPSAEPSGIEVMVPVKVDAWHLFHLDAIEFYRHWPVMPTIKGLDDVKLEKLNKYRNVPPSLKGENWEIRPPAGSAKGIAYMGWVPYTIDWNVLYHKMALDAKSRALFELLRSNDVILYFQLGDVEFVTSRESLEYTEKTINILKSRIEEIFAKIKDSIQEKFTDLPTIWDAKIMYNSIFSTGYLELESSENDDEIIENIKILNGNLSQLENTFKGAFSWKGITLDGASFTNLHRFDNSNPSSLIEDGKSPESPVLVTYRKKRSRVIVNRCDRYSNNIITASNSVLVVENDTGRKIGQQMVARYLIHGAPKPYKIVYFLSFTNKNVRDLFFKENHFETVPVSKMSDLWPTAKQWQTNNKTHREAKGERVSVYSVKYINIEGENIEEDKLSSQEIKEGGVYVLLDSVVHRRRRYLSSRPVYYVKGLNYHVIDANMNLCHFKTVVEELDLDVDKIFIINNKTLNSKWFDKNIKSGNWIDFWTLVKENSSNFSTKVDKLIDFGHYKDGLMCQTAARMLLPMIRDNTTHLSKYIDKISSFDIKTIDSIKHALVAFTSLNILSIIKGENTGTYDFKTASQYIKEKYPLVNWDNLAYKSEVNSELIINIAKYINAMDMYVNSTHGTEPIEKISSEE